MKSGFVELVIKNRLAGMPLSAPSRSSRYHPVDSFKKYITETLPNIQQSVEIDLLKKNLTKIASPLIRQQLVDAYLHRLFRLRLYEQQQVKNYKNIDEIVPQQSVTILDPTILKTINEHTVYDIGSYVLFSNDDFQKMFKHACYGTYKLKQWEYTKRFGIMIRRQSLALVEVMRLLQNAPDSYNWSSLYTMQPQNRLQFVNNQHIYPILFQQLSRYIYNKVKTDKHKQNWMRLWGNCIATDGIVNSVLQNIHQIDNVFNVIDQAIDYLNNLEITTSAEDFAKRIKIIPSNPPLPIVTTLPSYCKYYYTTPSFKNVFLGGLGGAGRSMILTYISMFALKNNWIVISVPDSSTWTQDHQAKPQRMYNGLFIIPQHAVQWLDQFKQANDHILKTMEVQMQLYGKYDITGIHEQQYEPVPNLYNTRRKTYFNEVAEKFKQRMLETNDARHKFRMTDIMPQPKSIVDILEAGIANPIYATCAMAEALLQVYQSNQCVLQCVDSFSWLYRPAYYRSFRYSNQRCLFGHIPPYHIAHCRLFINLDGHKLKRGLKVVAASRGKLYKHLFDIKMINYPPNYQHKVPNMTQQEFKRASRYNILTKYWQADQIMQQNFLYMHTLCQGNWKDFQAALELAHYT